jgi:hypothetical protein
MAPRSEGYQLLGGMSDDDLTIFFEDPREGIGKTRSGFLKSYAAEQVLPQVRSISRRPSTSKPLA